MADKIGLSYYLPRDRKPSTLIKIPGSHTLYVGPSACIRRHFIHNRLCGNNGGFSTLYVSEADVATGHYEDLIIDSIGSLNEILDPVPHIYIITVFCIDDFIGTDEDAMIKKLSERYPGFKFAFTHVNPISVNERLNGGMAKHFDLYSFIEPSPKDKGINLVGHFVPLDPECEFIPTLKAWGYGPIREIFNCKSYEEYQDMGKSCATIIMRNVGIAFESEQLKYVLKIPDYYFKNHYDALKIAESYKELAAFLGRPEPDYSEEITEIRRRASEVAAVVGDTPFAIDCNASLTLFRTALALIGYGFNVRYLFKSNGIRKLDAEEEQIIMESHPEIQVSRAVDYSNLYKEHHDEDCIAIGLDAGRIMRASHVVEIWRDEGFFGFHGIKKLLNAIENSFNTEFDWSKTPSLTNARKQ